MTKITVLPHADLCPRGKTIENATPGQSLCRVLLAHGIEIEHACEMSCACTTCHVIIRSGFDSLDAPGDNEEDMLDKAWALNAQSRLACQAIVKHQDLVIEIPRYTVNHAREHHS